MTNAKKAREMMERAIESEVTKRKENAINFCEELSKEIEVKANEKCCNLIIESPNNTAKAYVIEILKDNGYSVVVRGDGRLEIMW